MIHRHWLIVGSIEKSIEIIRDFERFRYCRFEIMTYPVTFGSLNPLQLTKKWFMLRQSSLLTIIAFNKETDERESQIRSAGISGCASASLVVLSFLPRGLPSGIACRVASFNPFSLGRWNVWRFLSNSRRVFNSSSLKVYFLTRLWGIIVSCVKTFRTWNPENY